MAVHELSFLLVLTLVFTLALIFGYIAQRLKLSPILGYLLVGVIVSPSTPGISVDPAFAAQLAELGVILLMFGVGLHLNWQDLFALKKIATVGAITQTVTATILGMIVALFYGWTITAGLVFGMAIAVASTVVLTRVLEDNKLLNTSSGHVAMAWLIVEDILTVLALVILPSLATPILETQTMPEWELALLIVWALVKLCIFAGGMYFFGSNLIPIIMTHVAKQNSRELFTVAILAIALIIACTSAFLFGASLALGAFIAGLVVRESEVSHQAAANALPLKDAFAVLFFVSVGMLFNPSLIYTDFNLILAALAITMIAKPLTAFFIVTWLKRPLKDALVVALSLSQIGEFSFILGNEALRLNILPQSGYETLIICSLVSITLNSILFRALAPIERWLKERKRVWGIPNLTPDKSAGKTFQFTKNKFKTTSTQNLAIVVGYGYVGKKVVEVLETSSYLTMVIDNKVEIIQGITKFNKLAIYGEGSHPEILRAAGIQEADLLVVTVPDPNTCLDIMKNARYLNPAIRIFVRARNIKHLSILEKGKPQALFFEEEEVAFALTRAIIKETRKQK